MSKKKILIHSIVFSPDSVSTAYIYNDIALRFKKEKYEVVVLTTTPHYNVLKTELEKQPLRSRWFGLFYTSNFHGIKVIHIVQKKFKSSFLRILGFIYWHILALFLGLAEKDIKVILSPSPPLTIGLINLLIGKIKGAKVIYNVQEIYPDFLINQGKLKIGFITRILRAIEYFVYDRSDAVTTIDKVFFRTISARVGKKDKLKIIPNFVDNELFKPVSGAASLLDDSIFPRNTDTLKLMYAGNIGHAQDWQALLELAKKMLSEKIEFWVIGEGVMKDFLQEEIQKYKLCNVYLVPYQSREKMSTLIDYADMHFIFMSQAMEGDGFPSKVYTIMACAKPLLVMSGSDTPIYNLLQPINCAYLINDVSLEDRCLTANNILNSLLKDKLQLKELGNRGLNHVKEAYSKDLVTMQYVELADKLINNSQ